MKVLNKIKSFGIGLWNLSIRRKLLLSYVFMIGLALIFFGSYAYFQARSQIKNNVVDDMNIILESKCHTIENEVVRCESGLVDVIRNKSIYDVIVTGYDYTRDGYVWTNLDEIFIPTIESVMKNNENIRKLSIYSLYNGPEVGTMILDENRIVNEEWYKKVQEKYGIQWFFEDGTFFAACVMLDIWNTREVDKENIGVGYLSMDSNVFWDEIEYNEDVGYIFYIIDENNQIISPDEDSHKVLEFSDNNMLKINGRLNACEIREISGTPWSMLVYIPHDRLYAGLSKMLWVFLLIAILCFLVFWGIGVMFSYVMTADISKLCIAIQEIGKGRLDINIPVTANNEIGIIATSLKDMLKELNETIQVLYKTKIEKQQQELKTLQAQINPHFLYNILSTVKWLAMEENADDTVSMIELLVTFYRTCLNRGETVISFEDEIKNVKAYVDMELVIYENSFEVEYDIDERIYDYDCVNFILQPIVENAIVHGISTRKELSEKGKIIIKATVDERVVVRISDNGQGMTKEVCDNIFMGDKKGYGLNNIQKRIKLMFGDEYGLKIISCEKGTDVIVSLPLICKGKETFLSKE